MGTRPHKDMLAFSFCIIFQLKFHQKKGLKMVQNACYISKHMVFVILVNLQLLLHDVHILMNHVQFYHLNQCVTKESKLSTVHWLASASTTAAVRVRVSTIFLYTDFSNMIFVYYINLYVFSALFPDFLYKIIRIRYLSEVICNCLEANHS